jgi:hypothetical protein
MKKIPVFLLLLCFVYSARLPAQTTQFTQSMDSSQFDMTGFPLWAKDLRRAEIIAFGSFPFAYFFANFIHNSFRFAKNGWDTRYAPFPFNSAGTIEQTQSQKFLTLGFAAGGAIIFAAVDYGIMRYKRNRREMEARSLPEGSPIIIRTPLYEEEIFEPEPEPVRFSSESVEAEEAEEIEEP